MRPAANSTIACMLLSMFLLAACNKPGPDFTISLRSSDGSRTATFSGYQPRGIAKGYILLKFENDDKKSNEPAAVFQQIENGQVGWISSDTIAIVADKLRFNDMASDYFPNGTVNSRIRFIACAQQDMDCSFIQGRLQEGSATRRIVRFPEG